MDFWLLNKKMKKLFVNKNKNRYTLVDDEDFDFLNQWKWRLNKRGYILRSTMINNKYTVIHMHRIIIKCPSEKMVDHISGNKSDNRKNNLRICNNLENSWNRAISKLNSSGYKGVNWHKASKKWEARIGFKNKRIHLGFFKNIKDAVNIYNVSAIKFYGEFVKTIKSL